MWNTIGDINQMILQSSIESFDYSVRSSRMNSKITNNWIGSSKDKKYETDDIQPNSDTSFKKFRQSTTPRNLSNHYPISSRALVERTFTDLLSGYTRIERDFQIPPHDVAGAVAAFLAGSYMAYHNVDFPDQDFPPLVRQMRRALGATPRFVRASNAEKQEMYEHLAILGMFMATTQMALKERPDPQIADSMRQAAKGYLEQFLKTDADRVKITRAGLVIQ